LIDGLIDRSIERCGNSTATSNRVAATASSNHNNSKRCPAVEAAAREMAVVEAAPVEAAAVEVAPV